MSKLATKKSTTKMAAAAAAKTAAGTSVKAKTTKKAKPRRQLSKKAFEKKIIASLPLVKMVAHRMAANLPFQVELAELINSGVIGLMDAIQKFDPKKGVQFKTYAVFRIRGAILDDLRRLDNVPRSVRQKRRELDEAVSNLEKKKGRGPSADEVAAHLNISLEEYHRVLGRVCGTRDYPVVVTDEDGTVVPMECPDDPDNNPLFHTENRELGQLVRTAITELPGKEGLVLKMYYFDEMTMREIADVLGITESRVSQIHSQAVGRLRTRFVSGQAPATKVRSDIRNVSSALQPSVAG